MLLVELADRVLTSFPPSLSRRAASLEQLGVEVLLGHTVVDVQTDGVELRPATAQARSRRRTVVWAAGVKASPLARALAEADGTEVDRPGRVTVEPDLSLPGHHEVFAIGDMVRVRDPDTGEPRVFPGLAPVAMQQGRYVGRLIAARLARPELDPRFATGTRAGSQRSGGRERLPTSTVCACGASRHG